MKDINEVLIFIKVAQLGSFSKASAALLIPVSTVSRKVSDLETRLGVTLILRTTRRLSLSEKGRKFFESCVSHVQGLEDAEALLVEGQASSEGVVRVTVPVSLGRGPFMDFAANFLKKNPGLKLDILFTNQFVDLVAENIDVAIRFGHLRDSSMVAKKLGWTRRVLVASPKYLKSKKLRAPEDLRHHQCILFNGRSMSAEWEVQSDRKKFLAKVSGVVSGSDFSSVCEFAVRGAGIGFLSEVYCRKELETGSLIRVLPRWSSPPVPVHAVYLSRKYLPTRVQVFLNSLSEWNEPSWEK